jgi:taurine dioxygenase
VPGGSTVLPMSLELHPVTGTFGAVVTGIDLREPLDDGTVAEIRKALLDHEILFFRDQPIDPDQHVRFASAFGELHLPPVRTKHSPRPEINVIDQTDGRGQGADNWHNDNTYVAEPPMGSVLHLVVQPSVGGDTCFASMTAAYDDLAAPVQRMLGELRAVHDVTKSLTKAQAYGHLEVDIDALRAQMPPVEHPVVRTHPESGRKALFVNPNSTVRIVDVSEAESDAILNLLYEHVKRPDFQYRFTWDETSVAFLDNRSCQHYAVPDYRERRVLHRVTIKGDRPY